jgi:hypothetical protein
MRGGHELERVSSAVYRVHPPGADPSLEFHFDGKLLARPCRMFYEDNRRPPVRLQYDKGQLTAIQIGASKRVVFEYIG